MQILCIFQNSMENHNSTLDGSRMQASLLERDLQTTNSDISELEKKVGTGFGANAQTLINISHAYGL